MNVHSHVASYRSETAVPMTRIITFFYKNSMIGLIIKFLSKD